MGDFLGDFSLSLGDFSTKTSGHPALSITFYWLSVKLSVAMKLIILSVVKLSFFGTSFVIFAYNLNTLIIITLFLITLYVIKLTTTLSEGRKFSTSGNNPVWGLGCPRFLILVTLFWSQNCWQFCHQGDQIGWFFCQLGYFWMPIVPVWKDEVAQRNGDILGYLLLKQLLYVITKISSFKTWFVVGILRFQKGFVVDVSDFKIGHLCSFMQFGFSIKLTHLNPIQYWFIHNQWQA